MRHAPDKPIRLHAVPEQRFRPCPSRFLAVLGFDAPTLIPCGDAEGHPGPHHKSFAWDDEAADNAPSQVDDRG